MKRLQELFNLKGKTAFVTGGAGYLGKAICETLAELGANLVIASRDETKCKDYARVITENFGVKAIGIGMDITSIDSIKAALSQIENEFGSIDILVNDAWSGNKNTFESISYEDWQYDINVCLNGVFYTIKETTPYLIKSKGVILNIASMYGHVSPDYRLYDGAKLANPPSYGAAKAGVIQLTKYLSSFLTEHSIRVNAISPGPFPFPQTGVDNPEFIQKLSDKNIVGRVGTPDDLKGAVALLCTDASKYMTGQNICVDGGWAVW
ncbi:SDR family oxidoreductase [Adhaeribacter sp. BT258]|uniref:SDR family oxidoreductase n=1 Tax=Adhaeribacter terrigena TaxID=2793070 RepID=A0ABS1BXB0_9BACT|nr:SDR family oxidoreductase [Adhaeribacter terrigena]MBK0401709.1 SDR family oxidoreductase [Adhaeribacter terrigena]